MPSVGPQLPPHLLEKRKRDRIDDEENEKGSSRSSSLDSTSKRQRTIGPTLPPAPLDERPPSSPSKSPPKNLNDSNESDTSSDDDDFGPSLPTSHGRNQTTSRPSHSPNARAPPSDPPEPTQRDAWMLVPPSSGDWTARVDPTKLKARKFNTSKSTTHPSTNASHAETWNETPEQKHARLQREMMGIKDPNTNVSSSSGSKKNTDKSARKDSEDKETRERMKEYNASRGPSLYEARQKRTQVEKDDDPSARAFDREKDIGGGLQINSTQRRDMMKKAGDFGKRFSSAKYL